MLYPARTASPGRALSAYGARPGQHGLGGNASLPRPLILLPVFAADVSHLCGRSPPRLHRVQTSHRHRHKTQEKRPAFRQGALFWYGGTGQQPPFQPIRLRRDPRTFQQSTGLLEPGGTLTARTCCSRPRWCTGKVEAPRDVATKKQPYTLCKAVFGAPSGTRTQDPLIKSQLLYHLLRPHLAQGSYSAVFAWN